MQAQGGDLSNALSNDSVGKLRWYRGGMSIALDVARGLSYLHSCKVCSHLPAGSYTCAPVCVRPMCRVVTRGGGAIGAAQCFVLTLAGITTLQTGQCMNGAGLAVLVC